MGEIVDDPVNQFLPYNKVPLNNTATVDDAVNLQTFLGLGMVMGTLCFGCIVVNKSKKCLISPQYLLQTSILGIGKNVCLAVKASANKKYTTCLHSTLLEARLIMRNSPQKEELF